MKLLTIFITMLSFNICHPQYDCENFPAIAISYIIPKTIAVGLDYFTEHGFTAGGGVAGTIPQHYEIKQGVNTYDSTGNSFDLFAYVGYRITRIDYTASLFINGGFTMGNEYKAQPFASMKLLIPLDQKAISFEPAYIFGRGVTGKISIHLKL